GLGADRVTGSTEDNVPSSATGIGVTVFATIASEYLHSSTVDAGTRVFCLGRPTSAPHDTVTRGDRRMIALSTLSAVRSVDGVRDVLPVGSKGVGVEAAVMAATHGLDLRLTTRDDNQAQHVLGGEVDLERSGGPASCVLVAVTDDAVDSML